MFGGKKGLSIVLFAVVSLWSCCQANSFFLPRISRTDDAIIIDLDGSGYDVPFQSKNWYGQIANPGFIPAVSSVNPFPMMFRQPSGWPYPSAYPSSLNPAGVPSIKQFDGEYGQEEETIDVKQVAGITCGTGPATMPKTGGLASERVTGGTNSIPRAWPFMVNLKNSLDSAIFCTGTLISDTRVLTAAQCLKQFPPYVLWGVTALFGSHLGDKSDAKMTRGIKQIIFHSNYNAANYANDIAIIVLDAPVVISRTVAPACLPPASTNPNQYVGQNAMILGWGSASPTPLVLQQAKVSIWSNFMCIGTDPNIGMYVSINTFCITPNTNNKFTCKEDLGGPVVILPSPGAWTVVGINSYTKDCFSNGIKTRVSAYRTWINQYMK